MRMKKLATLALGIMLAITGLVTSPAQAVDGGYFLARSAVLYDDCYDIQVPVQVSLPANITEWTVWATIVGPDGDTHTDYVDGVGNVGGGAVEVFTCGSEGDLGSYLVSGYISAYDANYTKYPYSMPSTSFSMTAPASKTSLQVSDRSVKTDDPVRFRVKVTGQSVRGYVGLDYTTVRLQYRVGGSGWKSFRRGNKLSTNSAGVLKETYLVNFTRNVQVRALTLGDGIFAPSKSNVITIAVS